MTSIGSEKSKHVVAYVIIGLVFLTAVIVGLAIFRPAKQTADAEAKADQLIAVIRSQGLSAPKKEVVVRLLGSDGGAVCADPNSALKRAVLNSMMSNGASGPGMRPVIAAPLSVRGQLLIMKIYCPDKLPDFTKYTDKLKFANVVKS